MGIHDGACAAVGLVGLVVVFFVDVVVVVVEDDVIGATDVDV